MVFNFYKNKFGEWYIDLPEYPGPKEDLQMVAGSDDLLDQLSGHTHSFTCVLSKYPIPNSIILHKDYGSPEPNSGENYLHGGERMWLCPATAYVFGEYPDRIFIEKL